MMDRITGKLRNLGVVGVTAMAFLAALMPTEAFAACTGQSYSQSYCLEGRRSNPSIFQDAYWRAKNICRGNMKVEISFYDRSSGGSQGSKEFTLAYNEQRSDHTESGVAHVRCCDSGTASLSIDGRSVKLCDVTGDEYSDWQQANPVITTEECAAEWALSDASEHCGDPDIEVVVESGGSNRCQISATCTPNGLSYSFTKGVRSALDNVSDLYICKEGFSHSECDYTCDDHYCSNADCIAEFNESPAADSCHNLSTSFTGPDKCDLTADCPTPNNWFYHLTLDDIDVENVDRVCNYYGTRLKVGGC